jgi:hypothetical protein
MARFVFSYLLVFVVFVSVVNCRIIRRGYKSDSNTCISDEIPEEMKEKFRVHEQMFLDSTLNSVKLKLVGENCVFEDWIDAFVRMFFEMQLFSSDVFHFGVSYFKNKAVKL